ncbi:MAG: outer membrane beta-barrel protein [Kordiimonas sp.]
MKTRALAHAAVALFSTTMIVPAAFAQQTADAPLTAIYDKPRADYDAPGIRSGGFMFKPSVTAEGKFDSNIYATDTATAPDVDDFVAIIKPSLKLDSNWNNHSLSLFADAAIAKYSDNGGEDYEDINLGANTRFDISRGTNITADLTYSSGHEDRGSAEPSSPVEPTTFNLFKAAVGFKRDEGKMSFAVNGDYTKQDFDNIALGSGGNIRNDDRDRETVNGSVRIGYHMTDEYEAFAKMTLTKVNYTNPADKGDTFRDNDGWDVVGGTAFKLTGTAEGEVFVGYVKRDYDAKSLQVGNISDFKFGASILWAPTGLTSARFAVSRDVVETSLADNAGTQAAGILSTLYSVDIQHELQRNLLLNAKASYTKMNFGGIARDDDLVDLGLGAKYLLNRNFSLTADYKYAKRDAEETGVANLNQDYKRHTFIVGLKAQW